MGPSPQESPHFPLSPPPRPTGLVTLGRSLANPYTSFIQSHPTPDSCPSVPCSLPLVRCCSPFVSLFCLLDFTPARGLGPGLSLTACSPCTILSRTLRPAGSIDSLSFPRWWAPLRAFRGVTLTCEWRGRGPMVIERGAWAVVVLAPGRAAQPMCPCPADGVTSASSSGTRGRCNPTSPSSREGERDTPRSAGCGANLKQGLVVASGQVAERTGGWPSGGSFQAAARGQLCATCPRSRLRPGLPVRSVRTLSTIPIPATSLSSVTSRGFRDVFLPESAGSTREATGGVGGPSVRDP